jgi:eukaryotic-like serine/threonine-protein kinase
MRVNGNWDIYSQRVGGRNAAPIVNDPGRNERGVAYSPDGSLIAFHESNATGGIFVAGATGEAVRRVTENGFDPAWSPDGKQIAFATEEINDPTSRWGDSTIWVVDVGGGTPRQVIETDAVQPSWSPSGERLVYWRNIGGQRDIYTVPVAGGEPTAVTNDAAVDWSPVWSPDGRYIYFSSDRGTSINLWRIAVDQSSGRVSGTPEPVTAGVQASAGLPRLSSDGSKLAFRSRVASVNPVAIPFDPVAMRAGEPVLLDTQNNIRIPSGTSPDGKQLAYYSIGQQQEDLFIGPVEGPMRRLTDDPGRDRMPMFAPDGRSLFFYSNRDGRWAIWTIGVDGGGLRKVSGPPTGAVYVNVSPKGDRVAFSDDAGREVFTVPVAPGSETAPTKLTGVATGSGRAFTATGWSPDGSRLSGFASGPSGRPAGVGIYDFGSGTTTVLSTEEPFLAEWLADSRRLIYFAKNGSELVVLDTATRSRTVVPVRLPWPASEEVFAISPDNRTIYYGGMRSEADIWIVERK